MLQFCETLERLSLLDSTGQIRSLCLNDKILVDIIHAIKSSISEALILLICQEV